jgi:hypothetical protein
MRSRSATLVWMIAAVYAALSIVAIVYALYKGNYSRANSEFAGVPLLLLAIPWSFVLRSFDPVIVQNKFNNSVVQMTGYILLNLAILAVIARTLGRAGRR